MTDTAPLTMYTTPWCGFCAQLKTALRSAAIPWVEVDIESDPDAAAFVGSINGGDHVVPTVKFADGTTLSNPTLREVQQRLAV